MKIIHTADIHLDAAMQKGLSPERSRARRDELLTAFLRLAEYAKAQGYANKGLIFIPELIPLGQKAVLAYLQDPFITFEYSSAPDTYYYVVNSFAFQTGIIYGAAWHESYSALTGGFADKVIKDGPWEHVEPLFKKDLEMSKEEFERFGQELYTLWKNQHEAYWKLNDPRQYTFNATLASFQLGVSMILEKLGY